MAHVGIVAAGVGGRVGFDVGTYEGCGEGAGIGALVGFDVGTCEKSNGDHRRALPESELCAVRCAYAVRRPSTRRRSPMTQAMYRSWFLHRDTHTTAEGSGPGTARSWACSSGCTTCADDKVAKRPHATRRLADGHAKFKFVFGSAPDGCGDGGKTGDAVGRDVGMYVGTLLVGTLVGV